MRDTTSMRSLGTIATEYPPPLSATAESPHAPTKIQCKQTKIINNKINTVRAVHTRRQHVARDSGAD